MKPILGLFIRTLAFVVGWYTTTGLVELAIELITDFSFIINCIGVVLFGAIVWQVWMLNWFVLGFPKGGQPLTAGKDRHTSA
jgi:hypothetical protein